MVDECKKGGAHVWIEVPVMGERFNETRIYCEKCYEVKIIRNPYEKPKRKFYLLSWKDWLKSAKHIGSTRM